MQPAKIVDWIRNQFRGPIARATQRTSFVLSLRLLIQTANLLIVARMLGAEKFGVFAGLAAFALFLAPSSTMGTHAYLLREVSRNPENGTRVLRFALPVTFGLGISLVAAYMTFSTLLLQVPIANWGAVICIGLAELVILPTLTLSRMERLGQERVAESQLLLVLPLGLRLIGAVLVSVYFVESPFQAYAVAYVVAALVGLIVAILPAGYHLPWVTNWRLPSQTEVRACMGYAVMSVTSRGPAELDKTIAMRLLPGESAGVYSAAARAVGAFTVPVTAMMLSSLPRLFRKSSSQADSGDKLIASTYAAASAYGFSIGIAAWVLAPGVTWLLGEQYDGLTGVMRWLTIAIPGIALSIVTSNILLTAGKAWMRVVFHVIGIIVLLAMTILLIPEFGIVGMALAFGISQWAMFLSGVVMIAWSASK